MEAAIDNLLIPALFGGEINENERDIVSLPINEGGLGIKRVERK